MTTTPKISIIIPVYNVEKYLRQCLDSVVNQTMQEIQIICVNDGSTDGSLAILREYEARDSRIEVIDKPNGGAASARNAGIAQVRGTYMYFVDSDDGIDPTLCEKTYCRLESTGADVVFFYFNEIDALGQEIHFTDSSWFCQWSTATQQASELFNFSCAPWTRVVRTSFFLNLGVRFPEVFLPEDLYMHWVLLANEPRVELIQEKLYHYRRLATSLMGKMGEYVAKDCLACSLIKDYLRNVGKYEQYRTALLVRKLNAAHRYYPNLRKDVQPNAIRWFRESLDEEERDFYRTAPKELLSKTARLFYEMIDGGTKEVVMYYYHVQISPIVQMPERILRQWIIKPIKERLKSA